MIACMYMTRFGQKTQLTKADKSCPRRNTYSQPMNIQTTYVQSTNQSTDNKYPCSFTNKHTFSQSMYRHNPSPTTMQSNYVHYTDNNCAFTNKHTVNIQTIPFYQPTNTQHPFTNKHLTPFHQQPYSQCKDITPFTNNHTIKL